jgi:hypothetical protein
VCPSTRVRIWATRTPVCTPFAFGVG